MVDMSVSRLSNSGSSPGRGHCVVLLGKTLHSRSASLHPGVLIKDLHHIQARVEILLVPTETGIISDLIGSLGLYTDLLQLIYLV